MEGLSLAFKNKQREGLLTGINVSRVVRILHLLFADDLLILNKASLSEWQVIKDLLTIFCSASGLQINNQKSSFYQFGVHQSALDSIKLTFNFSINNMTTGFKYLGYILKADTYRAEDWNWMLLKYENKINHWCNQWLSMGGRLVLAKAVLESQSVYWMALANIPASILHRIRQIVFNFLWNGKKRKKGFHLCSWHLIARPKRFGGWGLRNLFSFS
jgi:hypothetical protein